LWFGLRAWLSERRSGPIHDHPAFGDQYVFVALDADTKLVPSFMVGKRDVPVARAFIHDLRGRLGHRV